MLKRTLKLILTAMIVVNSLSFSGFVFGEETNEYEKKINSFDPEYCLWTNQMIDEGFADLSPNGDNKTATDVQTPYGRKGEYLTQWAYYEFLWTHGYPIGNGRMAATVMGGIDKEVIQINEDTVWTGSPYKDLNTGEPTSGSIKDAWQFYRGANADGTPAEIGSSDALVGPSEFRDAFPAFANKSISNMSLNVVNEETNKAVQGRYDLIAMVEKYFLGSPSRQKSYQSFVETYLDFGQKNALVTNYTKSLNMRNAVVTVDYDYENAHYTRESFASYPAQAVVTNVKVENGELNFNAELHTFLENPEFHKISDNQIKITAKVKDGKTSEVGGASVIKIEARLFVDAPDSNLSVSEDNKKILISGGNEATIYVVGASNYVDYLTVDDSKPNIECEKHVSALKGKNYEQIKREHIEDYKELFDRSSLTIENFGFNSEGIATEKRIREDINGKSGFSSGGGNKLSDANSYGVYSTFTKGDNKLAVLQFNYGKYLMVAGSRDGSSDIQISQPLNLTGKWNPSLSPSWNGKYTININTEMNYWLAQPLNLAECEKPLLNVFSELAKSGSITAREQYGIENSRGDESYQEGDPWVMHHNFDLWRGTQPIDNATAGVWPTGGIWLLDHAWQYYQFNKDEEYLAEFYPIMKGACDFFTQFLIIDPQTGYLVTAASVSPEQGSIQPGPAMDTQLVRNLYNSFINAAQILGKTEQDSVLIEKVKSQLPENGYFSDEKGKIAPNLIDSSGLIQEWVRGDVGFDFSGGDTWTVTNPFNGKTTGYKRHVASNNTEHRHCSHLYELYPGTNLSAYSENEDEKKIFEAYKKSVLARGAGSGQGWGVAWRIALSARALDGETAYSRIDQLLRTRTSPNLLGQHPNFQIDCNYGMTAGVVEMLMQSHDGTIDILPALPAKWREGKFEGFKARGNIEVGTKWKKGVPTRVNIKSIDGGTVKIRNPYVGTAVVKDENGNEIASTLESENTVIVFNADANVNYTITGFGELPLEEGLVVETWTKPANTTTDFFGVTASDGKNKVPKQETQNDPVNVGYIWDDKKGSEVGFAYPDCELDNLKKLSLNVNGRVDGIIYISVRKGSKDGEEIAQATASKGSYAPVEMTVKEGLSGKDKLFVVFRGDPESTYKEGYMCNVRELSGTTEKIVKNTDILTVYKGSEVYNKLAVSQGEYTIEVDFDKLDKVENAKVITAFYDENNKLVSEQKADLNKDNNKTVITVDNQKSKYNMKIMIWNDLDKMNPIREVKEYINQ